MDKSIGRPNQDDNQDQPDDREHPEDTEGTNTQRYTDKEHDPFPVARGSSSVLVWNTETVERNIRSYTLAPPQWGAIWSRYPTDTLTLEKKLGLRWGALQIRQVYCLPDRRMTCTTKTEPTHQQKHPVWPNCRVRSGYPRRYEVELLQTETASSNISSRICLTETRASSTSCPFHSRLCSPQHGVGLSFGRLRLCRKNWLAACGFGHAWILSCKVSVWECGSIILWCAPAVVVVGR